MSLEDELAELSTVYHGTREYVEELERGMVDCNTKIAKLANIAEDLFEITPAGPTKNALWRKYRSIIPKPPEAPLEGISGI